MLRRRYVGLQVAAIVALALVGAMVAGTQTTWAANETIRQIGSTTLLPVAEKWRAAFNKKHPNVDIAVSGGGSGTGIKALIAKTAEIADASRPIKSTEVTQAKAAGVDPVEHVVAYDGIAVIVNPANSLKEISVEKLSDAYTGKIRNWSDLGVRGLGEIQLVNRDSSSGTYEVFKEIVVQLEGKDKSRDFSPRTLNQTSNQAVLSLVARTKGAIGYVGLGYVDESIRVVKVMPKPGASAVAPSLSTVRDNSYPIARKLFCYTNGQPTGSLKQYLDWIKGTEGQAIAKDIGFVPISD